MLERIVLMINSFYSCTARKGIVKGYTSGRYKGISLFAKLYLCSRPSDNMFCVFRTICHVLLQALRGCPFGHHLIMAIWVRTFFWFPMMIKDS